MQDTTMNYTEKERGERCERERGRKGVRGKERGRIRKGKRREE